MERKYIDVAMHTVITFLRLIRWPNLLMVLAIQGICYRFLLDQNVTSFRLMEMLVVGLVTVFIAAGGYVINDYYDIRTDRINKPKHWIAGNLWSESSVLLVYRYLVISGGILAGITAIWMNLLPYVLLYPIAVGGLWWYSFSLKCRPVSGNLWVALFCGGVIITMALPDWLRGQMAAIKPALWYFAFFAFQSTWYREIVKDLEDRAGDAEIGCNTLPVKYGVRPASIIALLVATVLFASLYWWDITGPGSWRLFIFTVLQGALVGSVTLVWWAKEPAYYRHASTLIKGMMLAGTILMIT